MKTKHPNFTCPKCGVSEHYARGLCKACYMKMRHHNLVKTSQYPINLLLRIGISEESITEDMQERMEKLIPSKIFNRSDAEYVLYGIFRDCKTGTIVAKELNCTSQNVSIVLNDALEILRNPVCIDYLYGIVANLEDVVLYFTKKIKPKRKAVDCDISVSGVIINDILNSYESRVSEIPNHIEKVRKAIDECKYIEEYSDELPVNVRRAMERVGIKTIPDLMLASKILPHTKLFSKQAYDQIVEWAASIGITIREEFGIGVNIRRGGDTK